MRNPFGCCNASRGNDVVDRGTASATDKNEEEEALAKTVYHDARQSVTPSMMIQYPPATRASIKLSFSMERDPNELLLKINTNRVSIRESVLVRRLLQKQPITQQPQRGYPGDLTKEELAACLEFRKELKEKREEEPSYYEMVYCYRGIEDESYALCRYMRARKFVVPDAFTMMDGNLDTWKEGKKHDFYLDLEAAVGCPLSVLWTQFPFLYHGVAKNGAVVGYFQPGRIQLEGVECLTDIERIGSFIWNDSVYRFKDAVAEARTTHTDMVVSCENICVIDLKGLSRSLLTDRIINLLKTCCEGLGCFPELLNKMVIVNAPSFFSMSWIVIKRFLDPRTVAKIEIFSNEKKGNKSISEQINENELLSDYGGKGPSFDEVLQQQRKDGTSRQIVEQFFIAPHGDEECEFVLSSAEKATVVVFTRSEEGVHFSVLKSQETITKTQVKSNEEENEHPPYSREIASGIKGPGSVRVVVKSSSATRQCFLVVVKIYPMELAE